MDLLEMPHANNRPFILNTLLHEDTFANATVRGSSSSALFSILDGSLICEIGEALKSIKYQF